MCSAPTLHEIEPLFHCIVSVDKHSTKKNGKMSFFNKKTGKSWITTKPSAKRNEANLVGMLLQIKNNVKGVFPLTQDIHAEFIFYFDDYYTSKMVRRKNLPDLSNLLELPADALQNAGVIENDTQICSFNDSRRKPSEANTLEIYLWPMDAL